MSTISDSHTPLSAEIPPAVQSELTALRNDLTETKKRLLVLETTAPSDAPTRASNLVSLDSPVMSYALQLCQEIYPGCHVVPEVVADPEEPQRNWYSLNLQWKGDIQDMLQKDLLWHERFEAKYPHAANDFCLNSLPE